MTRRSVVVVLAALATGWLTAAQAQTQGSSSQGDIMPAVLAEVRGLRIAMEQMTAAGARVQLALGRLQLQEQRLIGANKRLDEVRNQLAGNQRRAAELQERVAELEAMLSGERAMPKPDSAHSADDIRKMISQQLPDAQRELAFVNVDVQRVAAQEATLTSEVADEQTRWTVLNQQLEDLERSLRPLK